MMPESPFLSALSRQTVDPRESRDHGSLQNARLINHLPRPGPDGRTQLILSPLELIRRIAVQPSPPVGTSAEESVETLHRSPARYLWAMLLARIYAAFPLNCPKCGAQMRIIAFITETASVQRILSHIGEPCTPPRIAPARAPLEWQADNSGTVVPREETFSHDALAQPEPDYDFDQRVTYLISAVPAAAAHCCPARQIHLVRPEKHPLKLPAGRHRSIATVRLSIAAPDKPRDRGAMHVGYLGVRGWISFYEGLYVNPQ